MYTNYESFFKNRMRTPPPLTSLELHLLARVDQLEQNAQQHSILLHHLLSRDHNPTPSSSPPSNLFSAFKPSSSAPASRVGIASQRPSSLSIPTSSKNGTPPLTPPLTATLSAKLSIQANNRESLGMGESAGLTLADKFDEDAAQETVELKAFETLGEDYLCIEQPTFESKDGFVDLGSVPVSFLASFLASPSSTPTVQFEHQLLLESGVAAPEYFDPNDLPYAPSSPPRPTPPTTLGEALETISDLQDDVLNLKHDLKELIAEVEELETTSQKMKREKRRLLQELAGRGTATVGDAAKLEREWDESIAEQKGREESTTTTTATIVSLSAIILKELTLAVGPTGSLLALERFLSLVATIHATGIAGPATKGYYKSREEKAKEEAKEKEEKAAERAVLAGEDPPAASVASKFPRYKPGEAQAAVIKIGMAVLPSIPLLKPALKAAPGAAKAVVANYIAKVDSTRPHHPH
ncbi:hypothetical protein RQP46_009231 [Phenoliferia psychrophenolica]